MKRRILASLFLVLALTLGGASAVSADHLEQTWVTIGDSTPLTGTLAGAPGGAFYYAKIEYPGNQTPLTIDLQVVPADPITIQGVGFNLYGPNGNLVGTGTLTGEGHLQLTHADSEAHDMVLQIYNYIPGSELNYSLKVTGLPVFVEVKEAGAKTSEEAAEAPELTEDKLLPMSGPLTGDPAGKFSRYAVFYGKDGEVTLTMDFVPSDNIIATGIDLSVYDSAGEVRYLSQTLNPNGFAVVRFNAIAGERYEVVVGNWLPNFTITYDINSSVDPQSVTTAEAIHTAPAAAPVIEEPVVRPR